MVCEGFFHPSYKKENACVHIVGERMVGEWMEEVD